MTLRFRADNFEAAATPLPEQDAGYLHLFIVEAPGYANQSVRIQGFQGTQRDTQAWSGSSGWLGLLPGATGDDAEVLALAISLLYSVPGVEVCE